MVVKVFLRVAVVIVEAALKWYGSCGGCGVSGGCGGGGCVLAGVVTEMVVVVVVVVVD